MRKNYEDHHRLVISDEALEAAVNLSARYISDRFLPDKAIDLIDESASRVRMYKSDTAKTSKKVMTDLREKRKEFNEACWSRIQIDEANSAGEERSANWKTSWKNCGKNGIAIPARLYLQMILRNWSPCGQVFRSCSWRQKNPPAC